MSKKLLEEMFKDARLSDGMIDVSSLEFGHFYQILKAGGYSPALDSDMLWHIIFTKSYRYSDFSSTSRVLTDEEKKEWAQRTHDLISNIPFRYNFFYELPEKYPLETEKLADTFEIFECSQQFVNQLEKLNPIDGLDKLRGMTGQNNNYRLLKPLKKYIKIADKGLVISGERAFLESNYSPDRLVGLFYSLHVINGNLTTDNIALSNPTPRVYDSKNIYRSNFSSPIKSSKAEHLIFSTNSEAIQSTNMSFTKLTSLNKNKDLEKARIQLCNSLYWYLEYLNTSEPSLQLVFLVSSFDSLFPQRKHTISTRTITPTVLEKGPLISDVISDDEISKLENLSTIEELFDVRNNVIHGKIEIHGYSKSKLGARTENRELVEKSEEILKAYLQIRLQKYFKS